MELFTKQELKKYGLHRGERTREEGRLTKDEIPTSSSVYFNMIAAGCDTVAGGRGTVALRAGLGRIGLQLRIQIFLEGLETP